MVAARVNNALLVRTLQRLSVGFQGKLPPHNFSVGDRGTWTLIPVRIKECFLKSELGPLNLGLHLAIQWIRTPITPTASIKLTRAQTSSLQSQQIDASGDP